MKNKFIHIVFLVCAAAVILSLPLLSFAEEIYSSRLDKGLKNTEAYSYVLIKKAGADHANAKNLLAEAIRYSPDFPPAYFEMSKTSFSFSPEGLFESLDYALQGMDAYKRNFWWLMSISALTYVSLVSSFILTLAAVIVIRFFVDSALLSHDIIENKKKIALVLSLLPLSFFGPLFFIAGASVLLGLYFSKTDKAVVYLSILLLLLSPVFLRITNTFLSLSSPELRAIVAVNENRDSEYALPILKGKPDTEALFSYGLALKREGRYAEAIEAYNNLLSSPAAPAAYVNLGNCYFITNELDKAEASYKKSIEMKPLASAYYNLSQLSREKFDFASGEKYFGEATRLDRESVSEFTSISSRNPNRFVIDETLPVSSLWRYAEGKTQNLIKISLLNPATTVIIAIALILLFYILDVNMESRAYRCKRCNTVLCEKCGKEMLWGQMCSRCYRSLVKLDELDSRERVAKLLEIQELRVHKRTITRGLAFAPPGIAHIYSGKILTGILLLWPFVFLLAMTALNPFLSTGLSLFSHVWLPIPALAVMLVLYLSSNVYVRRRIRRGWL